ncbi:DUF5655 domain-containing protein [Bacillus cereus]
MRRFGEEVSNTIDWSSPRLLCIAGGITKYDEHTVKQINRNIELYVYKHYEDGLLLLDLINTTSAQTVHTNDDTTALTTNRNTKVKTVTNYLEQSNRQLIDKFGALKLYMLALGADVQVKILKHYIAFKRIKNFACLEVHPQNDKILLYLKVDSKQVELQSGFTRDVSNIGHYGTGGLEVIITSDEGIEKAKHFINMSYDVS